MIRLRIIGAGVLLSLPLLFLIVAARWFWFSEVPKFESRERQRLSLTYRESAVELAERPEVATVERAPGWRQTGKIAGTPWGYVEENGQIRIWTGRGKTVRSVLLPAEETTDFAFVIGAGLAVVLVVVAVLTFLGFRFFLKMNRERADFVAAAAHDLETPVAALAMVLENRAAGIESDAAAIAECERLSLRLGRLVDNLRDFLHRGRRGAPVLTEFGLADAVRESYRPFANDYRDLLGKDVSVSGAGVFVRADETLVFQILWNLFANDLKYAAPYGAVEVFVTEAEGFGRATFVDAGRGLKASERRRIFERYYRAKSAMTSGKGGFGIGLCTAREFARAMGGDLTVRANEPKGCIFSLSLPVA